MTNTKKLLIQLCLLGALLLAVDARAQSNVVFTTMHYFTVFTNGAGPNAPLVQGSDGNFYGTTQTGGTNGGAGTIFKITTNGAITVLYDFTGGIDGSGPPGGLTLGSDGNFYGTTSEGGFNGVGTVFKISTNGVLTSLYSFNRASGFYPGTGLVQGTDGNFYGTTSSGGTNNNGIVFRISPSGTFTNLHSFTAGSDGYHSAALVQGTDGNFYGTTSAGGAHDFGTVFKISAGGTFTNLHSFTLGNDGGIPYAALIQGSDGNFYGTTSEGGTSGGGTVFKISSSGTLSSLYPFTGGNDGGGPDGALVQGSDGNFYGTAQEGGLYEAGTVFKITPAGAFTVLYSLTGTNNNGAFPNAGLVQGTDGNFYGTTEYGSIEINNTIITTYGQGTVFKISPSGTFTSLCFFNGVIDGMNPQCALLQGTNGNFYGTTEYGGTNSWGTIFIISASGALTDLYAFTGGNDGAYPQAGLIQGSDGNFYGTTENAGTNNGCGTVFKISASGAFTALYTFTGGNDGGFPEAGLIQGSDGNFYGTTYGGGTNSDGTVFKISASGAFTSLYSFTGGDDGGGPVAGLVQGSDGYFYGTAEYGGANGSGTVFKISASGALTTLYSFTGNNDGGYPQSGLVLGTDGNFYGTTFNGGTNFAGTVFKISPGGAFTGLYSFTYGNDGAYPQAGLIQGSDGNFYGSATQGGTNGYGTVFEISAGGLLTPLYSFNGISDGANPEAGLAQGFNGTFYGTTYNGGIGGNGTVFSLSTGLTGHTIVQFTAAPTNGTAPLAVQFNSPNVDNSGTNVVSWNWNFDDGATSPLQNPSHTYTALGIFIPTLVATNADDVTVISHGPQVIVFASSGNFTYITNNGAVTIIGYVGPGGVLTIPDTINGLPVTGIGTGAFAGDALTSVTIPSSVTNIGDYAFEDCASLASAYFLGNAPLDDGTVFVGDLTTVYYQPGTTGWGAAFGGVAVTPFQISANMTFTSLYSFTGGNDGGQPYAGLVQGSDGNFYGTTYGGGANGNGAVFEISAGGTFTNIYSFTGGNDGGQPYAGLVQGSDGNFYGTTYGGGTNFNGTVFKISPGGTLTGLYSFTGGNDGGQPEAGLVQGSDGNFYGTTWDGGTNGGGTVFKISPNGAFSSLYSFTYGGDGANPAAGLVQGSDGNFYGTAVYGGTNGNGTVFKISASGTLTPLYSFIGDDGANPYGTLFQASDGYFYGTTFGGGVNGWGTVFKISASGTLATLYSFTGGNDGANPYAGVVQGGDGNFYGTTYNSGAYGQGTLFEISASGAFTSLYSFTGLNDGGDPYAGLVQGSDGNFYGTTESDGADGQGTVFSLSTGLPNNSSIIQFLASSTSGPTPLTVQFDSPAVDSLGNAITSWTWNFGDGGTSTQQDPSHTYNTAGTFTPTLIATNINGLAVNGYGPQITVTSSGSSGNPTASFLWSERIASATSWPSDEPNVGLALDTNDNCYVTGWFDDTNNFGGVTLTNQSTGGSDVFVAKYNSVGALQWAQRAGGGAGNFNHGHGIGTDTNGNIYVAGGYQSPATFGGINLPATSGEEFFLAKYNSAGAVQWVQPSTGGSDDVDGLGLAVDGAGNSYAVVVVDHLGGAGASVSFGSTSVTIPASGSTTLTILVKYDNNGNAQWGILMGGGGEVYATKVAVDSAGNVYVHGLFEDTLTIGTTTLTLSPGSSEDTFVAKFNSSGTLQWIQQPQGNSNEGGVAVDSAGNVYISSGFMGTLNFGNGIILTNQAPSAIFGDGFVAKYNSAGTIQWAEEAGGTNGAFYWDVALDGQDNVYPAGFYGLDASVAKYNSNGALQWNCTASGPAASPVSSLVGKCAVDAAGNCFLDGWYQGTATFGTNTLQPQETWNYFLTEVASSTSAQAQYTFEPEVQSVSSAGLTYDSGTGAFQYTDAANSTEDYAYLPLTGAAAASITASNTWTASLAANLASDSLPCASGRSDHVVAGLGIINGFPTNFVFIFLAQENNTGGGDDQIYPNGWYGTAVRFLANKDGSSDITTPLGASLPSPDGSVYLPLAGGTNTVAGTESISAAGGTLTLNYNASTETVTGFYNGTSIGSYSLAGWGVNPPLTLVVWGGSGSGINVPAGVDTADNFFAGSLPSLAIGLSSGNVILTWPAGTSGYTLQSSTNLLSPVWSAVSPAPIVVNGQNTVTNPGVAPKMFYRLSP